MNNDNQNNMNVNEINNSLNINPTNQENIMQQPEVNQTNSVQKNNEPTKQKKNGKGKTILIIILILLVLSLGGYIGYDKFINKPVNNNTETDCSKCNDNNNKAQNDKNDNIKINENLQEIEKTIQQRYLYIYSKIGDGYSGQKDSIWTGNTDIISIAGLDYNASEVNLNELKKYFTEDAIYLMKRDRFFEKNNKYYAGDSFMKSIFGVTDQGERNLKIQKYDDNMVVAKADNSPECNGLCSPEYGGEYIVFKKVNGEWLVDMFE